MSTTVTGSPSRGQVASHLDALAAERDEIEPEPAAVTASFRDTERIVVNVMSRRDELRGLLGADQAKAAILALGGQPR